MNTGLIVLFVVLGICLLIGLPVAFSIGISCMALLTVNGYPPLDIVVQRMASGAKSFNMMAMPMFIFAGSLMVYGSTPRLMRADWGPRHLQPADSSARSQGPVWQALRLSARS